MRTLLRGRKNGIEVATSRTATLDLAERGGEKRADFVAAALQRQRQRSRRQREAAPWRAAAVQDGERSPHAPPQLQVCARIMAERFLAQQLARDTLHARGGRRERVTRHAGRRSAFRESTDVVARRRQRYWRRQFERGVAGRSAVVGGGRSVRHHAGHQARRGGCTALFVARPWSNYAPAAPLAELAVRPRVD